MLYQKHILAIKSLGSAALILGLAQTPAMGFNITLDEFTDFEGTNTEQFLFLFGNETEGTSNSDPDINLDSTVFGGQRTIKVTKGQDPRDPQTFAISAFSVSGGQANLNSNDNYVTIAEILWDGNDGGTPTNFLQNGQKFLRIEIASLNLGNDPEDGSADITLNFELRDTANESAVISQTLSSNITTTTDVFFPYSSRDNQSLNMETIDYVRFYTSSGNYGDDFTFNFIKTDVPFEFSPGLGLLISCGFFGFLGFRSRKVSKSEQL